MKGRETEVYVTGMGVVSPLGSGLAVTSEALRLGRRGLSPLTRFDASFSRCRVAGEARGFVPGEGRSRLEALAEEAAGQALFQAAQGGRPGGLEGLDPSRLAVFVSSSKGGMEAFPGLGKPDLGKSLEKFLSHEPGAVLRRSLGWTGGGGNYPLACATGGYSLGAAYEAIAEGRLDAALAGSVEASLTPLVWRSFDGLGVLAPLGEDASALRGPFDLDRQGFALGEGAGVVFLESGASLKRRGARPLAEMAGWACTADAHEALAPDPQGRQAGRCLALALEKAGPARAGGLGYLNAHGTGTRAGDAAEAGAIRLALGDRAAGLMVSGTKAATGHLLGAAGSVEAVFTLIALLEGRVPATLGVRRPMPGLGFDLVWEGARECRLESAASLSMGFGGHNVAVVFRKPG